MLGLTLLVFTLALYELKLMFRIRDHGIFFLTTSAGIGSLIFAFLSWTGSLPGLYPLITLGVYLSLLVLYYLFYQQISLSEIALLIFGLTWIGGSLLFFLGLGWLEETSEYNPRLFIILLALIWVNDVAAYLIGSFLGKKQFFPDISPGKTLEGFIAGIVFTIIGGYLVFVITDIHSALFWILSGLIISLGASFGDLFESKIKREAGVKDSGNIIPGHGGILDRFDSLFFSVPLFFLIYIIW
jgi:phosphatidate cytidylyltransferase